MNSYYSVMTGLLAFSLGGRSLWALPLAFPLAYLFALEDKPFASAITQAGFSDQRFMLEVLALAISGLLQSGTGLSLVLIERFIDALPFIYLCLSFYFGDLDELKPEEAEIERYNE